MLVVTFDEWGGFFDHVRPPQVVDDTDPATVDHTENGFTPTDGQLIPDYRQLGFRVPCIVVSSLAGARVAHDGPIEHTSTLRMIETIFGLKPLTARDANAMNLAQVLNRHVTAPVPQSAIPTSSEVPGPAGDAAAVCSSASVQSVSPAPVPGCHGHPEHVPAGGYPTRLGTGQMAQRYRKTPLS